MTSSVTIEKEYQEDDTEKQTSIAKIFGGNRSIIVLCVALLSISMSFFHLYTAGFGVLEAWQQRTITLSFVLILLPLLYPFKSSKRIITVVVDSLYIILALASVIYTLSVYPGITLRESIPTNLDVIFGTIVILLVLEGTRRAVGYFMTIIVLAFVLYTYFGAYFPGLLGHPGFSVDRMVATYYNSTFGMFGVVLGAMSNYIIVFIIFGAFLSKSQAGKFFIELAYSWTGSKTGGPAKVAVVASGLIGSIQGAAVSNVATTGTLTIPLMKRVGYKPHFAGGVEAAASAGGQLMPPIMGAAAFIIAANLKIPYIELALFALVPAFLHYFAVYLMVHFEAKKKGLEGIPKVELPNAKKVFVEGWFLFIPIIMIIGLLAKGFSPQLAGFYSIISIILVSAFRKDTRMSFKNILEALELGGKNSISVGIICAAAGLLIGSVNLTGLGLKFSSIVLGLSGDSLFLTLVLIMLSSLLLGMGMPTVSAYVILAVLGVPALIQLGVEPVSAHLFVLYFAIMSNVTPPVAVGAYTAAAIAGADPNKTGFAGLKISLGTFIIPFMFVYGPALVLQGTAMEIISAIISSIMGIFMLTAALNGWLLLRMGIIERVIGFSAALLLMYPGMLTDIIGVSLFVIAIGFQYALYKKAVQNKEVVMNDAGVNL